MLPCVLRTPPGADARWTDARATHGLDLTYSRSKGFQYSIVEEDGSDAIRRKARHAALEAERSMRATGAADRGALTASNYEFGDEHGAEAGLVQIGIRPKRHDTMLLEASILLTESDGDLVQVEGFLIKRPSLWTRHVAVVRRYSRISGVRVPVTTESTAQVVLMGRSTFSMAERGTRIDQWRTGGEGQSSPASGSSGTGSPPGATRQPPQTCSSPPKRIPAFMPKGTS